MTNYAKYGYIRLKITKRRIAKVTPSRLLAISGNIMYDLYFLKLSFQKHTLYIEKLLCWYVLNIEISTLIMNGRKHQEVHKSGKERKQSTRKNSWRWHNNKPDDLTNMTKSWIIHADIQSITSIYCINYLVYYLCFYKDL